MSLEQDFSKNVTDEKIMNDVAGMADRSEKTSWNRKLKNIQKLIAQTKEIEDEMSKLRARRQPLLDQIADYRTEMVDTCIHPIEYLTVHEGVVKCKFCERNIRLIQQSND